MITKDTFKKLSLWKMVGLAFVGIIFITIAIWLMGFALRVAFSVGGTSYSSAPSTYAPSYYGNGGVDTEMASDSFSPKLSTRNIVSPPYNGGSTGSDAESFEVTEYNGTIKTGNLDKTCGELEALKDSEDIIFENANTYDRGCQYTFKVANDEADDVALQIQEMNPETFGANTRTIKPVIADYTSEIEILQKKLASIEETLETAQASYDELEKLATQTKDAETLAKIIDSKVNLIERLANQRITIKEQIDRYSRAKAEELDRIEYTYFYISVYEQVIVDTKVLKNSWIYSFQRFVTEVNEVLQALSVGLVMVTLRIFQVVVYLLIALFIIKYGWRVTKYIWNK
jgi:hypothetical protein